jgi:hypothetical protein
MTLLIGNSETGFTVEKTVANGRAAAFAFTASETGLLEELQLRTNATANTGVTSVRLGVFAEESELPENVVQEGFYSGQPGTNAWIAVTGLAVPIVKNAKYWLVVMPIGGALHFNIHGTGGSAKWRSTSSEKSNLYEVGATEWGLSTAEGPLGFQGLGRAGVGTERKILFGINGGKADEGHASTWTSKKIIVGRSVEVEYTATPATVSTEVGEALALGISRPIVLIETPGEAALSSISTSAFAEGVKAIVQKVTEQHPSVRVFELINEPWERGPHHASNASDYAALMKAAYEKVAAAGITNVTLLVAAHGTYQKVNSAGEGTGEWSDLHSSKGWVADMLAAQPSLKAGGEYPITGWTSHPYGGPTEINTEFNSGFLSAVAQRESVRLHGGAGYNNWWITEVGFKIGGEGPSGVATEAEQSARLLEDLEQAQLLGEAGWLKGFVVYADSATELWNIYGKTAGTTYQNFANEHGLIPVAAFTVHLSSASVFTAKLAATQLFSARLTASSTLAATLSNGHPWSGATMKWEQDNFAWSEVDSKTEY